MFAFIHTLIMLFAAEPGHAGEGGFTEFYNTYLNYPGFELWKFINLALFVGLMVYILKRPLSEAFKAKRNAIRAELIKAEEEKQAALAQLVSAEAKLTQLESEKAEILKQAKDEAEAERLRLAEMTERDAERLREQAGGELSRLGQQTRNELRRFSAEESIRLAEQKLRDQIDGEKDAKLVRASIHAIGGLN